MNTTLAVQVTQEDIDKGEAVNCFKCPIALAVSRAMRNRGLYGEFSCYETVSCGPMGHSHRISLPNTEAYKWARQFDDFCGRNIPQPEPAEFIFFLE